MAEQHAHSYLQTHQMSGDLLRFHLNDEASACMEQAKGSPQGRAAKTLVREGQLRLTVLALRQGVALDEHVSPGATTIQVLRGTVRFTIAGQDLELNAGDVVALDGDPAHAVEGREDSVLLLTVTVPPGERSQAGRAG